MDKQIEQISEWGFGVMLWQNGSKGWLAALLDENNDEVPNSVNWDYRPTPSAAIQTLFDTLNRKIHGDLRFTGP